MYKQNLLFLMLIFVILNSGISSALTLKDASIEELTLESDLIVQAKVLSSRCIWENESLKKINTMIKLEVSQYLKSDGDDELEVVQMGGRIDDTEDIISGTPKLNKEDEVVLFLVQQNNQYKIHSIALGYYKIELNDKIQKIAVNDLRNVHLISENSNEVLSEVESIKSFLLLDLTNEIKENIK